MSNPLSAGDEIAKASLIAITAAAAAFPAAWPIASEAYQLQSDPGAMFDAGQDWLESAKKLGKAIDAAVAVNNDMPAHWSGADQQAFAQKMAEYIRQMMLAQVFAYTVGIAMITAALEIFLAILVLAGIAVGLTIFLTQYLVAAASVVGNAGATEIIAAEANVWASSASTGFQSITKAMAVSDKALAVGITAFLEWDVGLQLATGNRDALTDLVQATVDGLDTVLTGLGSLYVRDELAKAMSPAITKTGPGRSWLNDLAASTGVGSALSEAPWESLFRWVDTAH
jgi:hypothetical protein